MAKLLTKQEKARTNNASFISWDRLAKILENAGEARHSEFIAGFTLEEVGGLTIYRTYRDAQRPG